MSGKTTAPPKPKLPTREAFDALVKQANAGDEQALADLKRLLDDCPVLWQTAGDLGANAELSMIRLIAGGSQFIHESLLRKAADLKHELAGPSPSRLELLAVERVVACWLECQYVDATNPEPQGRTQRQANFNLRLKESSQRRFNAAMRSLLLVRKMLPDEPAPAGKADATKQRPMSKPKKSKRCHASATVTNGSSSVHKSGSPVSHADNGQTAKQRGKVPKNRIRALVGQNKSACELVANTSE